MVQGQDGFAIPFLYDSFIHYFTPVYPDAIQAKGLLHSGCDKARTVARYELLKQPDKQELSTAYPVCFSRRACPKLWGRLAVCEASHFGSWSGDC